MHLHVGTTNTKVLGYTGDIERTTESTYLCANCYTGPTSFMTSQTSKHYILLTNGPRKHFNGHNL